MQQDFDFVIIGAGAAGLTAAQYGARANLKTAVIESGTKGGQALLINELENYPGIFPAVNGFEFAQTMQNQAQTFGAQFFSGKVQSVDKYKGLFVIKTEKDQFTAKALLLATGAKHRSLGIPGEAELAGRGVSYCATCDGPFFKNKPMVVIGGGDGGTVREVLKHDTVEKVVLCEIDGDVVEECKKYLPTIAGQLDNPKVEILIQDAIEYIKTYKNAEDKNKWLEKFTFLR